jgi:hypothetical protein
MNDFRTPTKMTKNTASKKGKALAATSNAKTLESAAALMDQLKDMLQPVNSPPSQRKVQHKNKQKRLHSERDDSEGEPEDEGVEMAKRSKKQDTVSPSPLASSSHDNNNNSKTEYAAQVVILEGIKEDIKTHPAKLSKAFAEAKPNVELRQGGLRITASRDVLVIPKNPKDCCSLLKSDAFPANSPLGESVKARVPKSQQITHQVVIRNVDTSVTQEEMEEMLNRQELQFRAIKRIISREKNAPTTMFRLILKTDEQKKKMLKDGIFLDQMHFRCIQAIEDTRDSPKVLQCFNCQQLGDHMSSACNKPQKCVLCAGAHRKAECTKTTVEFSCANCLGNHAAWSNACSHRIKETKKNQKPTMAQVASATVTPALLNDIVNQIKEQIALVVAEVVARCLSELTLDLVNRSVSKASLPLKVATVANNTVKAVNKAGFGTKVIDAHAVKESIIKMCFDQEGKIAPSAPTTSQNARSSTQSQNV